MLKNKQIHLKISKSGDKRYNTELHTNKKGKMMKKIRYILYAIIIAIFLSAMTVTSYAENEGQSAPAQSENAIIEKSDSEDRLDEVLASNKQLLDIYDTWTSVISIVLIVVTVIGIVVPIYANIKTDKKIKSATNKMKAENEELMKKYISINNALMLSASKDYWSSNVILKDILKTDKENAYLHLLIGRNIFLQYIIECAPNELSAEHREDLEEAVNHYLFVAEHSKTKDNYFTLGVIFPDSIIHELCILTNRLIEDSLTNNAPNYHKLAVSVIKTIEKVLGIKSFDDIANEDQTNVHLMNYIGLNHELAKSYEHFGNIKAKEQYLYTIKLYSVSKELDYKSEIEECNKALERL